MRSATVGIPNGRVPPRHLLSVYQPVAPAAEDSCPTTADSRACRGCWQDQPRSPQSTAPSTPAAPWLAFTLLYASHTSLFGMSNGFALSTRFLPLLVDLGRELNNAAPSVQLHYRAFIPTTGCSAPVPRIGTLALMGASHLSFSLGIGATGSHVPCKSLIQSSRRLHAGCRPGSNQAIPQTRPGATTSPRFRHRRYAFDTSSAVCFRSSL